MTHSSLRRVWFRIARVLALGVACATSPARAEWPHDPRTPLTVIPGTAAAFQFVEAAVPDGSGGAYVFLADDRSGNRDVYAHHLRGDGTLDPAWPALGLAVTTAAGMQNSIRALDDQAGGLWVVWVDVGSGIPRVFATRVLKNGTLDPDFPVNGLPLDNVRPNGQRDPSICLNPAGSLVAVWEYDFSVSDHDIYGAEVTAAGTFLWSKGLLTSGFTDQKPDISPEQGGFSLAWIQETSCLYVRFSFFGGNQVGSQQVMTASTEPVTAPKVCPDGWGGTWVAFAVKAGSNGQVQVRRLFGGVPALDQGTFGSFQPSPYQVRLTYAGDFQAWFAFTSDGTSSAAMVSLHRDGHGPVLTFPPMIFTPTPQLAGDGSGGALLAIQYTEIGGTRIRVNRYNVANTLPNGLWTSTPQLVMQLVRDVTPTAICSDGNGGAIVFGVDAGLSPSLARAVRIDRWGAHDGSPLIQSVKDVANDQGGQVRVAWKASYLDRETQPYVDSYRLWRQVPVSGLELLRVRNASIFGEGPDDDVQPGAIRLDATAATTFAWELVTTQAANAFPSYSLTVETASDSTLGSPANTIYMVEARYSGGSVGWASPPDSGHSVDNLPPATPNPFTGSVMGGASTQLTWGANSESDLAGYELHRGSSPGFVPGPGNLVASTTATNFLDSGEVGDHYKLAAVDTHGNRSGYALVTPSGTLAAPGDRVPAVLALDVASANPSRDGATFRYALPSAGTVRLELFDVHGRLVREWSPGERGPGEYLEPWDGREGSGTTAASGVYFVRLRFAGRQLLRRVVLAH